MPARNHYNTDWLSTTGNTHAFEAMQRWCQGEGPLQLAIVGSCSKTFLALLASRISHAPVWDGALQPVQEHAVVIIDNADHIRDSEGFFHWYNDVVARNIAVLYTSADVPAAWPHALPDLLSRLRTLPVVRIGDWSDQELEMLLPKMMRAQGLDISEATSHFALQRMERSFAAVRQLVDYAHHQAPHRKITRAFLKEFFQKIA